MQGNGDGEIKAWTQAFSAEHDCFLEAMSLSCNKDEIKVLFTTFYLPKELLLLLLVGGCDCSNTFMVHSICSSRAEIVLLTLQVLLIWVAKARLNKQPAESVVTSARSHRYLPPTPSCKAIAEADCNSL